MLALQADILMVTDGEIPHPDESILAAINSMHREKGLEVHSLMVSPQVRNPHVGLDLAASLSATEQLLTDTSLCGAQSSEAMSKLSTHIHTFQSWTAVGGQPFMAYY